VVWVEGNHDHGLTNIMSHLVGVRVYQDYSWEYCGLRHIAIHGHQFDGFQVNRVRLSQWGTALYLRLQKMDLKGKPVARLIDRLNTRWLRMSPKVATGALAYAAQHGANRIFCGHTHEAIHVPQDGIDYYNSGGWVDSRLTHLTIDKQGVEIHEFDEHDYRELECGERVDDRDSGEERGDADSAFADLADESGLHEDVEYENISS
jgi:UDP-2,3-diacylglucosamine pyrophosphatase LpxH